MDDMKQYGVVIDVNEDRVTISVPRSSSCGENCGSCSGHCEISKMEIDIENTLYAQIGDRVEIESETKEILGAAFLVYILPIVALLIGVIITYGVMAKMNYESNDLVSLAVGLVFMALTFAGTSFYQKRKGKKQEQMFKMLRVM